MCSITYPSIINLFKKLKTPTNTITRINIFTPLKHLECKTVFLIF